jgi:hypothetical protein
VRLPPNWGGVSVASQERVTSGAAPVTASAVPHPELSRGVDSSELRVRRVRRDLNMGKTGQRRWKHNAQRPHALEPRAARTEVLR